VLAANKRTSADKTTIIDQVGTLRTMTTDWPRFLVQWVLQRLLRIALFVYFGEIEVVTQENVPEDGPVILVANHGNVGADVALVTGMCQPHGRIVISWAKSGLFATPLSNKFFRLVGAVPVFRKQDLPPGVVVDNDALYAATYTELAQGNIVLLFPEGKSYHDCKPQDLKKGVAWLVHGYHQRSGIRVPVIPCAINYFRKDKFRSGVLLEFGAPLFLCDKEDAAAVPAGTAAAEYDHELVTAATTRLQSVMHAMMMHDARDFEELALIQMCRSIYASGHRLELSQVVKLQRRFIDYYNAHRDQPEMQAMVARVAQFKEHVDQLGLKEYHFDEHLTVPEIMRLVLVRTAKFAAMLPLAMPGALIASPLYALTKYLHRHEKYIESRSQIKIVVIFVFIPLIYLLVLAAGGWLFGTAGAVTLALLVPLFGWAHVTLLEQGVQSFKQTFRLARLLWHLLLSSKHIAAVKQERAAIKAAIQARASQIFAANDRIISDEPDAPIDETDPEDRFL
jgi:glycerol-3-phosphate O-acyltransferase/dihydroxyacetone phosphate acyltransferase